MTITEENFAIPRKKEKLGNPYYKIVIRNRDEKELVKFTVNTLDQAAIICDNMVKDTEAGLHALLYRQEKQE
jgi:hypothetical protein